MNTTIVTSNSIEMVLTNKFTDDPMCSILRGKSCGGEPCKLWGICTKGRDFIKLEDFAPSECTISGHSYGYNCYVVCAGK